MEKVIKDIQGIYKAVQEVIDADKDGTAVTNELRSAAVKLGAAARHVERHVELLKRAATPAATPAAPNAAIPAAKSR